jgi:disulfide bond formation protein DsbB
MSLVSSLSDWTTRKSSWLILFASAFALEVAALVFQHAFGFAPCVMCIYQRTAMWGIVLAGTIVLAFNHTITRLLGYVTWAVSSIWGAKLAWEHVDILTAPNPFFSPCEPVPGFPSFMPLHEWLPSVFAAPGFCDDESWQFLGMGMPQWMQGIFVSYAVVCFAMLFIRLMDAKRL